MTSPYAFYQYFLNIEDASVITLLKVFSDRGQEDIAELERQVAEEPFRRAAQKALAGDMVTLVHGSEAYAAVLAASEALFGRGDLRSLDADTLRDAVAELPTGPVAVGMPITEALVAVGLVESRNAARRAIADGGASVNGTKVSDAESVLTEEDFLHGDLIPGNLLLTRGRLSGLIDLGTLTTGFPAWDLTCAWWVLGATGRRRLRDRLDVDDASWVWGRALAATQGLLADWFYAPRGHALAPLGARAVRECLSDLG